ncbi:MAG TPA: outer membrane beta-barrel protein, partial [Longimicrobium sp.]|nr:outer membrane beta-barrel protein [Longimicrobium sp.]
MMKKATFVLAALSVLGATGTGSAQSAIPLSVEIRGDVAIPTGDFADSFENGIGFTGIAALQLVPGFGVYGGYSRTSFSIDGADDDVLDQGYSAGLTASLGGGARRATPYIGAGLLFHELEVDDNELGDAKMGFEVGAGIAIPLG